MLNRITELLVHLNSLPSSAEGFSAGFMYVEGMKFGLTCREIQQSFLGKEKALSRGKYPAAVSAEVLAAAAAAPEKPEKKERSPRTSKGSRNTSTLVLEKVSTKTKEETEARKKLIAEIAQRHSSEDRTVSELAVTNRSTEKFEDEAAVVAEEFENILKSGVSLPELSLN
jgi:hypothetical protein